MIQQDSYALLMREHDEILILIRRLSALVDGGESRSDEAADVVRHLAEAVREHLEHEDALLYELAIAATPGVAADAAQNARSGFAQLKQAWNGYVDCWTVDAIAADRDAFAAETRAILHQLGDRLTMETQLLCAMALQPAATGPAS